MNWSLWVPGDIWTINAERKMHHHERAKLVQPLRFAARMMTRDAMNRRLVGKFVGPVTVTFLPVQKNRGPVADTANHLPACKAVLDGCVDAGLIPDDTPEWVHAQTFLPPERAVPARTGVHITFAPVYTATDAVRSGNRTE